MVTLQYAALGDPGSNPGSRYCSLGTTAVDARVNYPLYFTFLVALTNAVT